MSRYPAYSAGVLAGAVCLAGSLNFSGMALQAPVWARARGPSCIRVARRIGLTDHSTRPGVTAASIRSSRARPLRTGRASPPCATSASPCRRAVPAGASRAGGLSPASARSRASGG